MKICRRYFQSAMVCAAMYKPRGKIDMAAGKDPDELWPMIKVLQGLGSK